jgi:hypothetical protein
MVRVPDRCTVCLAGRNRVRSEQYSREAFRQAKTVQTLVCGTSPLARLVLVRRDVMTGGYARARAREIAAVRKKAARLELTLVES